MVRRIRAEGSLPLFPPTSNWKAPSLSDLPNWSRAKKVGFDTEFFDATLADLGCGARRGVKIAGYSFKLEGDRPYYIPVRHPEGNVDTEKGMQYLRDNAAGFEGELLGANVTGDLDVVSYDGVLFDWNKVTVRDVLVQGALIWELHRSYSLQNEALRRGFEGKDEKLLKESIQAHGYDVSGRDWKKWIAKMPAHYVGPYGEGDVEILFPVNDSQWDQAKAENLTQVLNLEAKVLVLLLKMRQRGVALDFDQLDRVEKMALDEENRILKEIFDATGVNIGLNNCMNAGKCAAALEAVGISVPICENGQPSITTEILSHIEHPVADKIRKLRQANKIRKTFVASMRTIRMRPAVRHSVVCRVLTPMPSSNRLEVSLPSLGARSGCRSRDVSG
jgi:DNA polymerase I-like protein with 3'-5' exonuclease and polymerase domains